jgi:Metallo-peptidase family M12B Reprolysin-like/Putative Ig domain
MRGGRFALGLAVLTVVAVSIPVGASGRPGDARSHGTATFWHHVSSRPAASHLGARPQVRPNAFRSFTLDRAAMKSVLAQAPRARAGARPIVVSLPAPDGTFQRFTLVRSAIMAPGLAKKHPDISTYSGRGVDDPAATIHADISGIGFHASVRSPQGAWYIDPYYRLDQSLYVSYYGRSLANAHGTFVERDANAAELSVDQGYYHAEDPVTVNGSGFAADADITITISDPEEAFADRTESAHSDENGAFTASFAADPDGNLETHIVGASDGENEAMTSYQVVRSDDPTTDPPTGDVLRAYRLALITDPGYAAYFGGSANVTPAKVALINRVSQVYEDDLSITLQLIGNTDLLNLDTWAAATAPNGPCGAAACFTQSQVTGCSSTTRARFVIGQIIGASNYDIGHLALGQPGGGVANLGVVGRSNKAGGCTGIPTPVGDFYAIDYVAHEMGHQFSGNHPFNGNQLNCSGGNRSAATSVEPGSGSSIMAYAGICLTDDLQPHSDPYFSQRSLQEISTYTSSNQAAINEVQTASLRHFGGGNEVQVATFGPGFQPTSTIQPLTVAIGAAPSAAQLGGAQEFGNTVTISTGAAGATHTLQVGDVVTISGVPVVGYNGTFTVTAVPSTRAFQYFNPVSGLATTGGGTITLNAPGLTESGNTVTVRTVAAHSRSVGDQVTISGAGNAGYNGTFTITAVPTPRSFELTNPTAGLPNSGAGTVTYTSPFRLRFGGNDSALIGSGGLAYSNANLQTAINGIAGFAGTVTVAGAASTGFTVTFGGASAGVDVSNLEFSGLSCGGCFASFEETNHGGANDSFRLNFNGGPASALITNGVNYTAAGIQAALTPLLPAGGTVTVAGFGGGGFSNTGFQMTFAGTLATTNIASVGLQSFSAGASGFVGETDKGGAVDNKGGSVTPTGDSFPVVTAPASFTIPLRTPFALTGSATDADGDPLTYIWEQNDRGGGAGTALMSNVKTNGPLFAMFPISAPISESDTLLYDSPNENHIGTDPTRVFPDLQQIIDNNTNADTGACPTAPIAPQVPLPLRECYFEFLPTSDYVGFAGTNASPLSLHMRFTVRDGRGGVNSADTTLLLASGTGPFRVTNPNAAATVKGSSTQTVMWDVAGTSGAPISTANVKISLSADGGHTYPYVLSASTPNDGTQAVTLPNIATTQARVKVEAVGNVFFDISNANFAIQALPVVTNDARGGTASVQYSDALSPTVTVSASDADSHGSDLTAVAVGLPAGLSLADGSVSGGSTLPGTHTWTVDGSTAAAPGSYPVTVTVTDETGGTGTTSFTIVVTQEDADVTYTGDMLAFTASGGSSANVVLRATIRDSAVVPGSGDTAPGDIRYATVTFKEGATTLCGPISVSLINGALTTGTASCTTSLAVNGHTIDIYVNGYYTGMGAGVVEVAQPNGSFVTGGAYRIIEHSAGTYAADAGSKLNVGFNVAYKNGKPQQGHLNAVFRHGGRLFQIKSTAIDSLGIALKSTGGGSCSGPPSPSCWGLADFRSKANLTDLNGGSNMSGLTLQVTFTDKGEPGLNDTIGLTLWDGNKLVFSSEWNGAKTLERPLDGGNTVVH